MASLRHHIRRVGFAAAIVVIAANGVAQSREGTARTEVPFPAETRQHASMPAGASHDHHDTQTDKDVELKRRGASAMGFDQDAATHHFRLYADGGAIDVAAGDDPGQTTREKVRAHLRTIALEFSRGEFGRPFHTHAENPPGVAVMKARRSAIAYRFEETPDGGRVRITTADEEALHAVHDFLRYQIREHETGDPVDVTP